MKKILFFLFVALFVCYTNASALTYPLSYTDIMSNEFGLKDDAISIYDEITVKNKASAEEELKVAEEWRNIILKKIDTKIRLRINYLKYAGN